MQLRLKELEVPTSSLRSSTEPPFDISKQIQFVPPFKEKEVDKYFLLFEKVATSLEWPREVWTLLLQSVLVGKAREVYSSMSVEQSAQYELVKSTILKAYELVPEAYQQHFRRSKKKEAQTFTEFAREKEVQFDRWCAALEVAQDYHKLCQIILLEEFKSCLPPHLKTYLDERKVDNLNQAAVSADDYSLTHKSTFFKPDTGEQTNSAGRQSSVPGQIYMQPRFRYDNPAQTHADGARATRSDIPVCLYCGHIISDCWELEKKKTRSNPVSTICAKQQSPVAFKQVNVPAKDEEKNPFISEGYVSLKKDGKAVPIHILRDTEATQSLLVEGILPFSKETVTRIQVLIQGVELGIVRVPLHSIHLQSDLISGDVVVGLRPTLPMEGVSFILGNDLAGDKVIPELQVVTDPEVMEEVDCDVETTSHVFPSCAVTRAMAREMAQKDCEDSLMNLADTFMSHPQGNDVKESSNHLKSSEVLEAGLNISERDKLIEEQMKDQDLARLAQEAVDDDDEFATTPNCYFKQSGVLMSKWRPRDVPATNTWRTVYQIVVPQSERQNVLKRNSARNSIGWSSGG